MNESAAAYKDSALKYHTLHNLVADNPVTGMTAGANESLYALECLCFDISEKLSGVAADAVVPAISRMVDDRLWLKTASGLGKADDTLPDSRFPVNQPDMPVSVAVLRCALIRHIPRDSELAALRECIEIMVAAAYKRPVDRTLFSEESLASATWEQESAYQNFENARQAVRRRKGSALEEITCQ